MERVAVVFVSVDIALGLPLSGCRVLPVGDQSGDLPSYHLGNLGGVTVGYLQLPHHLVGHVHGGVADDIEGEVDVLSFACSSNRSAPAMSESGSSSALTGGFNYRNRTRVTLFVCDLNFENDGIVLRVDLPGYLHVRALFHPCRRVRVAAATSGGAVDQHRRGIGAVQRKKKTVQK